MKTGGVLGAILGGVVGAALWALIVSLTKYEIGYMAIGVGFLVGFGSAYFGGKGMANGILCAAVAIVAIFIGKVVSTKMIMPGVLREEMLASAPAEGENKPPSEAEVDALVNTLSNSLTWQDYISATSESLDAIDMLFAVIGAAAAFQIGGGRKEAERSPVQVPEYPSYGATPPPSTGAGPAAPPPPSGPVASNEPPPPPPPVSP